MNLLKQKEKIMAYTLPELGYAYDALEPHFDAQTMEIHHSKHHQAYVNNANAVLENSPELQELAGGCPGKLLSHLHDVAPFLNEAFLAQDKGERRQEYQAPD